MKDNVKEWMQADNALQEEYYTKSVTKTEQHKFLETLLPPLPLPKCKIADVGCGGGTLSYHLKEHFVNADFYLYDYYDKAIELAKEINKEEIFNFKIADIYNMPADKSNFFDYTFAWQVFTWLEEPQRALKELIRITKPSGKIYICSTFNIEHDCDIYAKIYDYTRESGQKDIPINYNTLSFYSIKQWLDGIVNYYRIHQFDIKIDLPKESRGLGTYTRRVEQTGENLQISGGYLMNWGILEITK
jgi:ubiquinone/menaquinone biosynthesis C-methylase UbiE